MTPALLDARDVSVRFGGLVALDRVALTVHDRSIVGLIGPNGAGKTTFFGVLSGLLRPSSGTVRFAGVDMTRTSPPARARLGLARTFQRVELFDELTVREHVVLAHRVRTRRRRLLLDLAGLGHREDRAEREAVDSTLALVGLERVANAPARTLGLGTARLVELARAIATRPRLLLLDEPSSGLDARETDMLTTVFARLREEQDLALVLVEHNVQMVLGLADRVVVLDFGEVIAEGEPHAVRDDPAVRAAYLGTAT
jgi:ABC-type branched-subunit amino acid transport system ATPase component